MNKKRDHTMWRIVFTCMLVIAGWAGSQLPALAQEPLIEENQKCLICHNSPDITIEFPDGSSVSGHVSGDIYTDSVHGRQEMTCGGCHPNHEAYPHPEVTAAGDRQYTMEQNEICFDCHPDQADLVEDSNHAHALEAGNLEAAMCVDCHGAHDTISMHESRVEIAATCRQCHAAIYDDYRVSAHGKALIEEHNTDVPTCIDCHGVHNMEDPTTIEFRLNSPNLCGNCHANEAMMSKYNISTDVFETYVADFHGTTVTLFEKQSPDAPTNKAVCYDCHGVHDIRAMDDPQAIAASKQNLLATCQKCHPDATLNFPDSWASHYQPTLEKQPLVAAVNIFYLIFIPGVLGFMGLFVVTDAGRRMFGRDKGRQHGEAQASSEPQEDTQADQLAGSSADESDQKPENAK